MTQDARAFNWDSIPVKTGVTANPAPNANPVGFTVPASKRYLLTALEFTLVTDANVANRTISCVIAMDGTNNYMYVTTTTAQTATMTRYYRFDLLKTYGETYSGGFYMTGLGLMNGLELPAGAVVTFAIASRQVGDDATATTYLYKEAPA